jgi:hypothetical protein
MKNLNGMHRCRLPTWEQSRAGLELRGYRAVTKHGLLHFLER